MAASVATRAFFMTLAPEARPEFYGLLLPRMCLNRYYVAEGVRIFSQKSWAQVAGSEGKTLIERYIAETVDYYISQSEAENHAVREAACACIAELGAKVSLFFLHGSGRFVAAVCLLVPLTLIVLRSTPMRWYLSSASF